MAIVPASRCATDRAYIRRHCAIKRLAHCCGCPREARTEVGHDALMRRALDLVLLAAFGLYSAAEPDLSRRGHGFECAVGHDRWALRPCR